MPDLTHDTATEWKDSAGFIYYVTNYSDYYAVTRKKPGSHTRPRFRHPELSQSTSKVLALKHLRIFAYKHNLIPVR